jgi:hypothetical protein
MIHLFNTMQGTWTFTKFLECIQYDAFNMTMNDEHLRKYRTPFPF